MGSEMTKRIALCTLALICMVSGCASQEELPGSENTENGVEVTMSAVDGNDTGGQDIEIVLMTKEEFINYIEENQDLETVDITVGDLDGIDIDDFIAYWNFTEEVIGHRYLKKALETYLQDIEDQNRSAYFAHEIVNVDSTDEEYTEFLDRFIASITDGEILASGKEKDVVDHFRVYYEDSDGKEMSENMWIGQTKYLDEFGTRCVEPSGIYLIQIPWDSSGFGYEGQLFYNKNQKFFMTGDGKFEWGIQFTEME